MMIQNRVVDLSATTLSPAAPSSAQDPLKKNLIGCSGAGAYSPVPNLPISYGKPTSAYSLQSNFAGMSGCQPTLTKIAALVREILLQFLSRLLQNNASANGVVQQSSGLSQQKRSGQNMSSTNNPVDFSKFSLIPVSSSGTGNDALTAGGVKATSLVSAPVSSRSPVEYTSAGTTTSFITTPDSVDASERGTSKIKVVSLATSTTSSSTTKTDTSTDNKSTSNKAPMLSTTQSVSGAVNGDASSGSTDKVASTTVISAVPASKSSGLVGMTGFAKAANTTGGAGGKVVTVSTVAELQKSLAGDEPTTIKLSKDLSSANKVVLKFGANKTLEGTSGGTGLHNIYLASDKTAGNDIFQNLNFTHDDRYRANGDIPLFISNGSGYWIDHNTFSGTKDKDATGLDKLLYVGGKADNVTLSNSVFKNNEYGVILGQPDDSASAKATYGGYPRMTIANNVFDNLDVRAPGLMRQGKFDVYNNTINNFHLGYTIASNATVLSQANYFRGGYDVHHKNSIAGVLDDKGDAAGFKDIGSNVTFKQSSSTTDWVPTEYSRKIKTPEAANAYNLANAGAGKGGFA